MWQARDPNLCSRRALAVLARSSCRDQCRGRFADDRGAPVLREYRCNLGQPSLY